jgi:hypothetical protein
MATAALIVAPSPLAGGCCTRARTLAPWGDPGITETGMAA